MLLTAKRCAVGSFFIMGAIMEAIFYMNTENRNKIDKLLVNGTEYNITPRAELDLENPVLYLSFNPLDNFNYVKLDNKYYFINSAFMERFNYWRVNLSLDVLNTYKDQINNCTCTIIESENPNANKIDCVMSDDYAVKTLNLNDVFDRSGKMYLTTVFKGA